MKQLSDLDFNSVAKILNLPIATAAGHPVVYEQLNSALEGIAWKDNCRVATQSNLNLAAPGASVDGIAMAVNDRFLVRSQTSVPENGIYIWNGAAVAATRSLDANSFDELEAAITTVDEGTSAGTTYRQTQVNGVIATNNVIWTTFGVTAPAASETVAGVAELATQTETDTGTDDLRIVTPLKLATSPWANRGYTTNFGDGSALSYTITHNLNSKNVGVQIYRVASPYDTIGCDIERTTVNSLTLRFAAAPTTNQFTVTVQKNI